MDHSQHTMNTDDALSFWQRFKMSMGMTMGMDHSGLAGRAMAKMMEIDIRRKFFFSLILSVPIILYSPVGEQLLGLHLPAPIPVPWILFILTTPLYFYSGWIFLYSSYHALKQRTLNMAVLIAVGITAAYGFSVYLTITGGKDSFYEAAALLITFVLFGHWMEMKSRRGTTDALQALFDLVPPKARLFKNGKETSVATSMIKVGDILILKPGDRVPVDGTITTGETSVDEALVTGESLPVVKSVGDHLIAGSINDSGSVRFTATKVGNDTALAQIVKMVETAQNSKAPGQRLADRFAGYLVIVAISAGLLTFAVWIIAGYSVIFALTLAISAIVIACPDALGLATPTAVAVGTGMGARHNILIKDASTLEQTSKIQAVVMDKTGTLTEGKPRVTDVITANGFSEIDVLRLTAAAEVSSNHPLSKAVIDAVTQKKATIPTDVTKFLSISGHGVQARVEGKLVLVGTFRLMKDKKVNVTNMQASADTLLSEGKTLMILAVNGKVAGIIAAQDPVKPTAKLAIKRMKELGIQVAMLTGDNQQTADAIAKTLGITRVFAEVLPEDKAKYVKKLQKEGLFVAMVGDGVNDAPALAQADIGIAIGAGTDVAIETAKVVLMKSDPTDILRAIRLSKATIRKMKQNLAWASIYNVAAIPIAAGVLYPAFGITLRPEVSALLMSISSIIVAVNAVLLKRSEKDLVHV
jgi:Cu2+-exporting ATPase